MPLQSVGSTLGSATIVVLTHINPLAIVMAAVINNKQPIATLLATTFAITILLVTILVVAILVVAILVAIVLGDLHIWLSIEVRADFF